MSCDNLFHDCHAATHSWPSCIDPFLSVIQWSIPLCRVVTNSWLHVMLWPFPCCHAVTNFWLSSGYKFLAVMHRLFPDCHATAHSWMSSCDPFLTVMRWPFPCLMSLPNHCGLGVFMQFYLGLECKCRLEQLQKLIKYPFEQIACGICELHATLKISATYRWEGLI